MIKTIDVTVQGETTLAIQTYLKRLQFKDLSPNTISKYTLCLRCYEKWLTGERPSEDSAQAFLNFLRQKNLSWASVQAYYHAIRPFLADQGIKFQVKFRKCHTTHLPTYRSPEQVDAILRAAQNRTDKWKHLSRRDSLMIRVFAYTGIRKGELMALRVRDINFLTHMIRVLGKGDKERVIPIDDRIYKLLENHTKKMQVTDRLFPLSSSRIGVIIKNYARTAGIADFHPHSFRHYFATQLVRSRVNSETGLVEPGVELKEVQQLLGHASISTTAIYIDVIPEHLRKAISHLPNLMEDKK
jgi:site-specific recombinase XerD